jgi:N-methylhydantoinase B
MVVGHGVQVPNSVGQFGGMPGACAFHFLRKSNSDIAALINANTHIHDLFAGGGSVQRLEAKLGHFALRQGDVFAYSFQGGGGYGDPIRRDPARVAGDVNNGMIRVERAAEIYGVVLREGAADADATGARRNAIRSERLDGQEPKAKLPPQVDGLAEVCPKIDNGHFRCLCGADFGPATQDWKARAQRKTIPPQACGPYLTLHAELELREFVCSECGTLLEIEVARLGQQSLETIVLDA